MGTYLLKVTFTYTYLFFQQRQVPGPVEGARIEAWNFFLNFSHFWGSFTLLWEGFFPWVVCFVFPVLGESPLLETKSQGRSSNQSRNN